MTKFVGIANIIGPSVSSGCWEVKLGNTAVTVPLGKTSEIDVGTRVFTVEGTNKGIYISDGKYGSNVAQGIQLTMHDIPITVKFRK